MSLLEAGKVAPSARTLYALVGELGISVDEIFGGHSQAVTNDRLGSPDAVVEHVAAKAATGPVQRVRARPLAVLESGVRWERLTARDEPGFEALWVTYPSGSSSSEALLRHTGREFGVVLRGRLGVTLAREEYSLGPGDSIIFASTTPHRLYNNDTETVEAVWVRLR